MIDSGIAETNLPLLSLPHPAKIFLASTTSLLRADAAVDQKELSSLRALRAEIHAAGQGVGRYFVAELDVPLLSAERLGSLAVAKFLLRAIRECEHFVCLLGGDSWEPPASRIRRDWKHLF